MAQEAHESSEGIAPSGRRVAYSVLVRFGPVIGLAFLCLVLSVSSEAFLNPANLINIARQVSINAALTIGLLYCLFPFDAILTGFLRNGRNSS